MATAGRAFATASPPAQRDRSLGDVCRGSTSLLRRTACWRRSGGPDLRVLDRRLIDLNTDDVDVVTLGIALYLLADDA
jgi:hypothetical protein